MNPLHIPRTVLACVGVVIDTAVRMHCQNRDYEAAVRAAAPKNFAGAAASLADGGNSPGACCVTPSVREDKQQAPADPHSDPAASATAAPSPAIPPVGDTDPVGVVDGPPASAAPAGPPSGDDLPAMDCCGGVVGHYWACPTQAERRGTGTTGTWRLTADELDLLGLKPGDQLGPGVVGPPISSAHSAFHPTP